MSGFQLKSREEFNSLTEKEKEEYRQKLFTASLIKSSHYPVRIAAGIHCERLNINKNFFEFFVLPRKWFKVISSKEAIILKNDLDQKGVEHFLP